MKVAKKKKKVVTKGTKKTKKCPKKFVRKLRKKKN